MTDLANTKPRAGWKTIPFGKAVKNITERAEPTAEDSELYIGLEHLDSGTLTVRRWGSERELEGTKLRMRKGDVLFAKRNAYLKRVAITPHDGLFSAHGMVLRANPKVMLHEFLPFFMQSDHFWDRAIGISVGSLSPTINWKTLAAEEFALPPIEEQRELALVLSAVRDAHQNLLDIIEQGESLRDSLIATLIEYGTKGETRRRTEMGWFPASWDLRPLGERFEIQLGKMMSPQARSGNSQVPYMRNANVQWGQLDLSDVATMSIAVSERERFGLRAGDILACEGRHVGKSVIWNDEIPGACYQKALHRLRPRDRSIDLPEFMILCLRLYSVSGRFIRATGETTIPHLPAERFREIVFPFPPLTEQRVICDHVALLNRQLTATKTRAETYNQVHNRLIAEVFG